MCPEVVSRLQRCWLRHCSFEDALFGLFFEVLKKRRKQRLLCSVLHCIVQKKLPQIINLLNKAHVVVDVVMEFMSTVDSCIFATFDFFGLSTLDVCSPYVMKYVACNFKDASAFIYSEIVHDCSFMLLFCAKAAVDSIFVSLLFWELPIIFEKKPWTSDVPTLQT